MGKIAGSFREGLPESNMKQIFRHEKGVHVIPLLILGKSNGC